MCDLNGICNCKLELVKMKFTLESGNVGDGESAPFEVHVLAEKKNARLTLKVGI